MKSIDYSTLLSNSEVQAKKWLNYDLDKNEINEIKNLLKSKNKDLLIDSFYKNLEFGTGGMRGIIGIGTNRINKYTISMATQGLSNYIKKSSENKSAVIAYDSRKYSKEFAHQTANIFSANKIKCYLFSELRPTPQLSFAVRELNCTCGVVITASHNPKEYNGYKVYWNDGGQITSPHDTNIIKEVSKVNSLNKINNEKDKSLIYILDNDIDNKYINKIKKLSFNNNTNSKLKIVFSSLHGTGITQVPKALNSFGFNNISIVQDQSKPDENFSTVKSPNPEEIDALDLGINQLINENADILLATDPDSDRVGVAINTQNKISILNGNQLATLIIYYIIKHIDLKKINKSPFIAKTIVTTSLIEKIAKKNNISCYSTLTGFKYIAELIRERKNEKFIAGGEESYGYLVDDFVRDKDAIISSAVICEIASWALLSNKNLIDILEDIYDDYGLYVEKLYTIKMEGITGKEKIDSIMRDFREKAPSTIFDDKVIKIIDYMDKTENPIIKDKSNVIQLISQKKYIITLRPSGTEPKLKFYFCVNSKNSNKNKIKLNSLIDSEIMKIKKRYE